MPSEGRNWGNEIVIAIAVLGMLALSVLFAVVLTLQSYWEQAATPVASATAQSAVPTDTLTPLVETAPPTDTVVPSPSPALSATLSPTASPTSKATDTSVPSPTPTATRRPLNAAAPTTAVAAVTQTAATTLEAAALATTSAPPGETATPSHTPSPALTATETPTAPLVLATPVTPSPVAPPPTPADCVPPQGWVPYTVRRGENLFRISLRAGVSYSTLQAANCLADPRFIQAGQVIYVPPGTAQVAPVPAGQALPPESLAGGSVLPPPMIGCLVPQVQISAPLPGATLFGQFSVRGTATLSDLENFSFFKVEIRQSTEPDSAYRNLSLVEEPAPGPNDLLATINPASFGPGVYLIRLTVVDATGNFPGPCTIRVTFP